MTEPLTEELRAAVGDAPPIRSTPDGLLGLARARRRRRRGLRAAALAVVAGATAAAIVVPALGDGSRGTVGSVGPASTAPTTATDTTTPAADPVLTDAEVVRRCRPQLDKYVADFSIAPEPIEVAHDRDYRAGDFVLLHDPRTREVGPGFETYAGGSAVCVVPEAGRETDPVRFEEVELQRGDTDERVLGLCSETWRPDPGEDPWFDLRGGRVLAVDHEGPRGVALIRRGADLLSCTTLPLRDHDDLGTSTVDWALRDNVYLDASTVGIKGGGPEARAFYYGAGVVRRDAEELRFTLSDGTVFERPVTNGAWAAILTTPAPGGVLDVTTEALDADGRVLETWGPP